MGKIYSEIKEYSFLEEDKFEALIERLAEIVVVKIQELKNETIRLAKVENLAQIEGKRFRLILEAIKDSKVFKQWKVSARIEFNKFEE